MNESTKCAHDGQLIDQCIDCIRKGFPIEIGSRAIGIKLSDLECELIANTINAFDDRNPESYYDSDLRGETDLIDKIIAQFDDHAELIIEFMEIYIYG